MSSNQAVLWKSIFAGFPRIFRGETKAAASIQSILVRMLVIGLNTATGVLTARLLGAEGRGEQAAMILWQGLLAGMFTFGLPSALVYNFRRHAENRAQLFGAAMLLGALFGVAAGAVGVVLIPYWLSQYSPQVVREAQFLMTIAPIAVLMLICRAALEARGDYAASNATLLLTPLITLIGLLALVAANAFTPFNSAFVYSLSSVPIFIWTLVVLRRFYSPTVQDFRRNSGALLSFGLRSYGADLLGTISGQIDQVLVIGMLAPEAMGKYVVALNLSRMLYVVQSSLVMVLYTQSAAQPAAEVVRMTGQFARVSVAVTVAASAAMMLGGSFVLQLLYGGEFKDAVPLLDVLIVEAGLGGTAWILTTGFLALGKPGTVTILQAVGLALSVPLLLVLVPRYGIYGASVALLISTFVRLILVQLCFRLLLKVPAPSLVIKREDFQMLRRVLFNR